ncbi:MAG TPA: trypsin-like peptidase domain-containing protein [Opitutales bacterium]|jgi:S1-C subfamily serine protease|nr:trypsin-like peptidase domain-containing protein [Opitutales bacterium]
MFVSPSRAHNIFVSLCALLAAVGLLMPSGLHAAATPAPAAATDAAAPAPDGVEKSVVKIFATTRYPDVFKPWTKQPPREISGTGVIIDGHRILTNAHMVLYTSQIQLQANGSGDKVTASVVAVAPGIDLAILKVNDDSFFDGHPPLTRAAKLPDNKDAVLVYGYPTGGDNLSITKGIVSRIEFTNYNGFTDGLRIQVDAPINPGNSGGPAIANGQMIGLAFSRLGGADNIGYIIPNEEIELFLNSIPDGKYTGKPAMYDELQTLENPALRPFLKIDKSVHGIIVNDPFGKDADYPLKKWDIITKIGDTAVDDQGMITLPGDLRVAFQYLIQKVAKDGKVPLTVVRDGKEVSVQLPVSPVRDSLFPFLDGKYPSYYIFGPLVFSVATDDFVSSIANANSLTYLSFIGSPLMTRRGDKPAFPGEQLVVVASPLFSHDIDVGYEKEPVAWVLKSVNGTPIKNLLQLAQLLNDSKDEFLKFEFAGTGLETFIFPRQALKDSTTGILSDNDILSQGSPDILKALSDAKP